MDRLRRYSPSCFRPRFWPSVICCDDLSRRNSASGPKINFRNSSSSCARVQPVPRKWVEDATSKQISNENEGHAQIGPDWKEGYGFQFWRCRHNAFRADGAGGQFIVMMHDQDVVVAITAETGNLQGELDAIWDHLLPAFQSKPLPADAAGQEKLKEAVANLAAHPKKSEN
jgi:CubicO group peptidase (beta-lactamase class C family)